MTAKFERYASMYSPEWAGRAEWEHLPALRAWVPLWLSRLLSRVLGW